MHKLTKSLIIGTGALILVPSVFAASPFRGNLERDEHIASVQAKKQERQELKDDFKNKVGNVVSSLKKMIGSRAYIKKATVTANNTTTLTITKDGKTYTVNITSATKLRRRFYGQSKTTEISVGDQVDVVGKWVDDAQTTINAALIRDISIQKRFGAFIGIVQTISGNDITFKSVARGVQKATVGSLTKFVNRKDKTITLGDIKVGDRIRVKGMWDNKANTITEVTQVKDFSIPVRQEETGEATPAPTGSPAPTVIPTVTPTSAPVPTVTPTIVPTTTPVPTSTPTVTPTTTPAV